MIIQGFNVTPLVKKTVKEIGKDRIPSLAAETAYYFFFSLFPLLLFLTPLLGLLGNGQALMESLLARLATTLPADALSLLRKTLTEIIASSGGAGIMSLGALLAGWSGSSIFGTLMDALNIAYDVSETRPLWKRIALRLACLVLSGIIVLAATFVFLDGEAVSAWVGRTFHLGQASVALLTLLQLLLAVFLVVALCVALFKVLPNVQQRWTHVIVASMATTVLWIVATLVFRFYVQHFGSFNKTYGTIGGVIALLSWMYYTMFVVLCGGELASEMHHGSGALDPLKGEVYRGRIVSDSGPGTPSMEKFKPSR
ncbi:MAG: YihY/virulence factor BrkB family protein [Gemmatimonadota bacterium]|nr:YihY/virulence factor BrkB family protein [Gemmatimonadota bacterium]